MYIYIYIWILIFTRKETIEIQMVKVLDGSIKGFTGMTNHRGNRYMLPS